MNELAYLFATDARSLIVAAILVGVVVWLIFYVLPLPPPVRTALAVVIAILLVLWLIPGCTSLADYQKTVQSRSDSLAVDASKEGAFGGAYTHSVTYR